MLPLLFAGGFVTKIAMIGLLVGALSMGGSCAFKSIQLSRAETKVASLEVNVKQLSTDNAILKDNNAVLKKNLETAAEVNGTTVEANRKLLEERKSASLAIAALAKSREAEAMRTAEANKKIQEMLKGPKNNGPVAPVLRETIREIQRRGK